jgi:WD40 repeat protein/serine/threonine protein kinase
MTSSPSSSSDRNPVEALAEEFLDRKRRGEEPSLDDYCQRHPELAQEIRELFPLLLRMEDLGADSGGGGTGRGATKSDVRPERLGDFRILREVGRGGMGVVYEAEQESLGRRVAIKVLSESALADPKRVLRFEREARAAARLHHTNIVPVFGVGRDGGHHFYVMQFIPGMGLDAVLEELRRLRGSTGTTPAPMGRSPACGEVSAAEVAEAILTGRFSTSLSGSGGGAPGAEPGAAVATDRPADHCLTNQTPSSVCLPGVSSDSLAGTSADRLYYRSVARIGQQVADALEYANRQGVLHRDIKPANLLVDPKGNVWVTDFGLAKATDTLDVTDAGDLLGTVRYMAPERFEGKCDARSDVYALGLTLYELLALRPAFEEADRRALIRQVMNQEPRPLGRSLPHLPRDLETIVVKAIARDAAGRYPTAMALADDLRRFLDDKPIHARRLGAAEQAWRWARRNPTVAGSLGAVAAALLAVAALALLYAHRQARDAARIRELAGETTKASRKAEEQARRAVSALGQSNLRLAALNYERGQDACEKGEIGLGLLRLVAAWRSAGAAGDAAAGWSYAARANLAAWQRHQPELQAVFSHAGSVYSVAFSPDQKTVLTGCSDNTARLWDVATGRPLGQPLAHQGPVAAAAFSPDGKTVLTGCSDNTARLWDAVTGRSLGQALMHEGPVQAVAFSPDGKTVLTGSSDSTARFWDAATGQWIGQTLTHQGWVSAVAFSPDGKTVLTGGADNTARFWDAATGRPLDLTLMHQGRVRAVAFSPDGQSVLTGSEDQTAQHWDAATGQPIGPALRHQSFVTAVGFSPDGKTVVTASLDRTARFWDAATGRPLGPTLRHEGPVWAMALGSDGKTVLTGGSNAARVWNAAADSSFGRVLTHQGGVRAVAFSPDGKTVLTGGEENMARLWDAATGRPRGQTLTHQRPVSALAFSPDGKTILTASVDHTARLWDAAMGQPLGQPLTHQHPVYAAAFSPDGKTVLTGSADTTARFWDAATGRTRGRTLTHQGSVWALAFSPDGKTILTAGQNDSARFWDAATGQPLGETQTHQGWVFAVAFSPSGKTVITGNWDHTARLWDAATGRPAGPCLTHRSPVRGVAFSPDGKTVLTGSRDHSARLWDAATGQPLGPPLTHQGPVEAVAFSPDGETVLTGSMDRTARLWDVAAALPDQLERVATWVEVLTGLELDEFGSARVLESAAWLERRAMLTRLGGPPAAGPKR